MENSNKLCILPFTHLSVSPNGSTHLCCRSWPNLGNIDETSMREIWNSDKMKEVRLAMVNDQEHSHCVDCWSAERAGGVSMRMGKNKLYPDIPAKVNEMSDDGTMPFDIPYLEVKPSNICNLRCRMCSPAYSTKWFAAYKNYEEYFQKYKKEVPDWIEKDGMIKLDKIMGNQSFMEDFASLAPHLREVQIVGGEPLIDPACYEMLEILRPYAENIILRYSTNLTELSIPKRSVLDYWGDYKHVVLTVSIDGYPELNDYIRDGNNSKKVEENIKYLSSQFSNLTFAGACTTQIFNAWDLYKTYEYIDSLGISIHSSKVITPEHLNVQNMPDTLKQEIYDRNMSYQFNPITPVNKEKYRQHMTTNMKYMMQPGKPELFNEFFRLVDHIKHIEGKEYLHTNIYNKYKDE